MSTRSAARWLTLGLLTAALSLSFGATASAQSFRDEFAGPTLDPAWQTWAFGGTRVYSYTSPANHYSLTDSPGALRYGVDPMTYYDGFLNAYQLHTSTYQYDPGLEIHRDLTGERWRLETRATYYLPATNGRLFSVRVYFGDGGPGTVTMEVRRGRDGGYNALLFSVMKMTGPAWPANQTPLTSAEPVQSFNDTQTVWLRIERDGGILTGRFSLDGTNWNTAVSYDLGTQLDGLAQRLTLVGQSWFNPAGSYADYDYVDFDAAPTAKLFGGANDQQAFGGAIADGALTVVGSHGSGHALLAHFETLPPASEDWNRVQDPANAAFHGTARVGDTVFAVGGGLPPSCGAQDNLGSVEAKPILARFEASSTLAGCQSTNVFPYSGGESFTAVIGVRLGSTAFAYATGQAENSGGGNTLFFLDRYSESGTFAGRTNDTGGGFSGGNGLAFLDGFVYVAGHSGLVGESGGPGTGVTMPVLLKYDTNLSRVWKQRSTGSAGFFNAVTSMGGFLYAAGNTYSSGGGTNYPNPAAGSANYLVEKYSVDGVLQWHQVWGGGNDDVLTGIVAVGSRLFAVGYTKSSGAGGMDAVVFEIDPATGARLAEQLWGGANDDRLNAVVTDGNDVYAVGETRSYASAEGNVVGSNEVVVLRLQLRTNEVPVADAGSNRLVQTTGPGGATLPLDASLSSDPDGDPLTYAWTGPFVENGGNAWGTAPAVTLPVGHHSITLRVSDGAATATDTVVVDVEDPTLSVTKAGNGGGVVSSAPSGIDCGATCQAAFTGGTLVSLSATPDPGSLFEGWAGGCSGAGACSVAMDASHSVTATFTHTSYTLAVAKAGSGAGTVSSSPGGIDCGETCVAPYDEGAVVTLRATAGPGSYFAGWSGACSGTLLTCELTMGGPQSAVALFDVSQHALTVVKTGRGVGAVSSTPEGISCGQQCVGAFPHDSVVTLTATPDAGSLFGMWGGSCAGTAPTCDVTMSGSGGPTTPRAGLVAEWLFDGNALDSSGNAHHGTVSGAQPAVDRFGRPGRAYAFDGASFISGSADGLPTGDRTISLWFNASSLDRPTLLGYGGGACGTSAFIGLNQGDGVENAVQYQGHCGVDRLIVPYATSPIGAWHHLVFATDATGSRFYLDGALLGSNATHAVNTQVAGTQFALGSATSPGGSAPYTDWALQNLVGALDDVRIYDRALTEAEIATLLLEGGSELAVATFHSATAAQISGAVTDATTLAPLVGVPVEAFDGRGQYLQTATTDSSGRYLLDFPTGGSYYLRTRNGQSYADEQYNHVPCPNGSCDTAGGTGVVLASGSSVSNIDFALRPGGSISGTITAEGPGTPIAGVQVRAADTTGRHLAWATTDSNGIYALTGLPAGSFHVVTDSTLGFVDELYLNVTCPGGSCGSYFGTGTPVPVASGTTTGDINFSLDAGGAISGTVTASGAPLAGAQLQFFDTTGRGVGWASTDGSGSYTSPGLPTGSYYVATRNGQGHVDELYLGVVCPNASCQANASGGTLVPVTTGVITPSINFNLGAGGAIAGTVADQGTGTRLGNVQMRLADATGRHLSWAATNAVGEYTLTGMPTGSYYVLTIGTRGYVDELYNDVPCAGGMCMPSFGQGTPVSVTSGGTISAIDFVLSPGMSISGTVTDAATGLPVANVNVDFSDSAGNGVGGATTNATGVYLTSGLPAGIYYARTTNWAGYVEEVYDNRPCPPQCDNLAGTPITVAEGVDQAGVDFALDRGGSLSGTVTDALSGLPLPNTNVEVWDSTGNGVGGGTTDAAGAYTTRGLPAGTYYAMVRGVPGHLGRLYDNIPCTGCNATSGTPIVVTLGQTTSGINFALTPGGGRISGRIRDAATGLTIANAWLDVHTATGAYVATGYQDAAGAQTVEGLPAGTYHARANNSAGYVNEVWDNRPCPPQCDILGGTSITVADGVTAGVDFALDRGGSISGTVTDALTGLPLPNANVGIFDSNGNGAGGWNTSGAGVYTAGGLPAGTYYAMVRNVPGHLGGLYDNISCTVCNVTSGTPIVVTAGHATTGINFALTPGGGGISGRITDAATGLLIADAWMDVFTATGAYITSANRDATGAQTFYGLPAGSYYARANNSAGYVSEVFDNRPCPPQCDILSGTPITVVDGLLTTGIDFALDRGGSISGTVTRDGTGAPLGGVQMRATDATGQHLAWATTSTSGAYELSGLPAGSYYVLTIDTPSYIDELYDGVACPGGACAPYSGVGFPVPVAVGSTRTGTDFALSPGGSVSGTVTDAVTGLPLSNARVDIRDSAGNNVGGGTTNAVGFYTTGGVPAGTYYARVASGSFRCEFYNDVPCGGGNPVTAGATPITVGPTGTTTGIDFALTLGASISGRVTGAETQAPLTNATVVVIDDRLDSVAWLGVNGNGEYQTGGLPAGTYRVWATTWGNGGYIGEVYDDVQWLGWPWGARGTRLTLAAGESRGGINLALGRGATIHGRITNAVDGEAASGVTVGLTKGWNFQTTQTDSNGYYTLTGVPAGSYFELNARGDHYMGGCWGGGPSETYTGPRHPACTPLTVAEGQVLDSLDFSLESYLSGARKLAGSVTDATTHAPLANVTVSVYDRNGTPVASGTTQADGTYYTREDIFAGLYYLRADNAAGYVSQCYGGVACPYLPDGRHLATGTPVTVLRVPSPGTLGGHDFALTTGGRVSGRITDVITGNPLAGTAVVYDSQGHVVARATADAQGQYTTVPDVPAGTYYVVARDSRHLPRLHGGASAPECSIDPPIRPLTGYACNPALGDEVTVAADATTSGIDLALEAGHFIGGAIMEDGSSFGIAGINGYVYDASGTVVGNFGTDFTGGFLSGPLPEGILFLRTYNWTGYIDEALGGQPCGQNCVPTFGTPVTTSGSAVPWVEFSLALGPRIVGTVRDANGEVVAGRDVHVYDANGVLVTDGVTARDGLYWTSNGLPPGTYYARTQSATGLADQLYQALPCAGSCDPTDGTGIVISTASDTTGIDFVVADPNPLPPSFSIGDATVTEGNLGDYTTVELPVTLSRAWGQALSVDWQTLNETAQANNNDYVAASGTLTFEPGTTSQTIPIIIRGDSIREADETFVVRLNNSAPASIADFEGRVTILDDDPAPTVSILDTSLREGQSGSKTVLVVAHLSNPSSTPVTVDYATADGTAIAGQDYVPASGTLTFPGVNEVFTTGGNSQVVEVTINGDTASEGDETFHVTLSSPNGASIADGDALVTILDDEGQAEPTLTGNWQLAQEGIPSVYTVASGGGQYVLAGGGGEIWTSADGDAWQKHAADPLRRTLRAATWGNGRYVVVGQVGGPDSLPAAFWSVDGSTWQVGDTTQAAGYNLLGVAYGAGTFVAVGAGGKAFTSSDGSVWTMRTTPIGARLDAIAFGTPGGNGLFVAVAYNHRVLTSPDGITWTLYNPPGPSTVILNSVAWTGTQFVAVGGDSAGGTARTILTSLDGATWTLLDTVTRPLYGVAAGDGHVVAVGNAEPTAPTTDQGWVSQDGGSTWTVLSLPAMTPGVGTAFRAVAFGNAVFVAAGTSGNVYLTDGTSGWTDHTPPTARTYNAVAHDGTRYCAVGARGLSATSTDGVSWTNHTALDPATYSWYDVIATEGRFLAVGNAIASSTDCVNWTKVAPADPFDPGGSPWTMAKVVNGGNGRYVAVGWNTPLDQPVSPRILTSTDGSTWTDATPDLPAGNRAQFAAVAYGAGRFVAFAEDAQGGVRIHLNTSPDGVTWTRQATPFFDENYEDVSELLYADGQFVLATDRLWTSTDGLSWTLRKGYSSDYYRGLSHANGRHVAVGIGGGIATSADAATWTNNTSPTGHDWNAVVHATNSNQAVAVGVSAIAYSDWAFLHTLTVDKTGTGTGSVTSNPAGIDCGTTCSASFAELGSVSLSATPAPGSVFIGWSGACTGATCAVTMSGAMSVTAQFAQRPVAVDDSYTTERDTALTVPASGVLTNDTAPLGSTLTSIIDTTTTHGTLSLGLDGSFTYTPAPGYTGPDAFTYRAVDAITQSTIATVHLTVTPRNDAPVPVIWTHDVGVSISGNTLTKAVGTSWDAGAVSTKGIGSGDGYVEFTATSTAGSWMAGLGSGDTSTSFTDIEFALFLHSDGTVLVYEGGSYRGYFGNYASNDRFRVGIEGGVVRYRKNGELLYESGTPVAPGQYPLVLDTSLNAVGSIVSDAYIAGSLVDVWPISTDQPVPVVWAHDVGLNVSGNSISKVRGFSWDAGAVSTKGIGSGNGYVEFGTTDVTNSWMAGLGSGDTSRGFEDIEYGLFGYQGNLLIYEGGSYAGFFGNYVATDRFRVGVEDGVVRYRKNGMVFYESATLVTPSQYPLVVDTSLYSLGATVSNAVIAGSLVDVWPPLTASPVNVVWTHDVGVTLSGNSMTKLLGVSWDSGAVSTQGIASGNGCVEFGAVDTTSSWMAGLGSGDTGVTFPDIEYGLFLYEGNLLIYEGGSYRGYFGSYAASDRFRVCVEDGLVRYRKNGEVFYESPTPVSAGQYPLVLDTSLYSVGATVSDAKLAGSLVDVWPVSSDVPVPVAWAHDVGLEVSGNNATKVRGFSWDSGAVSTKGISSGNGYVEFSAIDTTSDWMAGLGHGDESRSFVDIEYGLFLYEGNLLIYEGGSYRGYFGHYVSTDRFRVGVEDGVVRYRQNGVVFYESPTPIQAGQYPLVLDTSFYSVGSAISDAVMAGSLVDVWPPLTATPLPVAWTHLVGGAEASGNNLTKTSGGGWDSGAVSTKALASGNGYVEFTADMASWMGGLGKDDTSASYTDIEYGIFLYHGQVHVYESGIYRGYFTSYEAGDRFRVAVEDGIVRYRKNGVTFYESSVVVNALSYPLALDTALNEVGSTVGNATIAGALVDVVP